MLQGHTRGLQAPGQAGSHEPAEGEAHQHQRQVRMGSTHPGGDRLGIVDFACAHVVAASALPDPTIVEA
ncbi:hypothetical protein D3C76_1875640 [compost metagenome]